MSSSLEGMPGNVTAADDFVGNKVIDREGIEYGRVKHVHIDRDALTVSGVTVHQGFHKDYFLPTDYVDKFTGETLLLSRPPIRTGIPVVDIDQHKLGTLKRIHRDHATNEIESIEVGTGMMHSRMLPKSEIWGVGEQVILKMTRDEFKASE